jgi:hypothetical protein
MSLVFSASTLCGRVIKSGGVLMLSTLLGVGADAFALSTAHTSMLISRADSATGRIMGAVFDSTQDEPLLGALVRLTPGNQTATTDSAGEFTFDKLAPGTYTISVSHRTITGLGERLEKSDVKVEAGKITGLDLVTPGPAAVRARFCGKEASADSGALVGNVARANDGTPASGATVTFIYDAPTPTDPDHFDTIQVKTSTDGRFAFCGLPTRFWGRAKAQGDGPATVELTAEAVASNTRLAVLSFTVGTSTTRLRGKVLSPTGEPISRAWVQLLGSQNHSVSEKDGAFSINNAPMGTQRVIVRRVGYAARGDLVEIGTSNTPITITLEPTDATKTLTPVNIEEILLPRLLAEVGFAKRRGVGKGYFMTAAEFANKPGREVADIFRGVPGLRVQGGIPHQQVSFGASRENVPCVYVDGFDVDPTALDEMMGRDAIAAVEIYEGGTAPSRFRQCANDDQYQRTPTIIIWTKWRIQEW